jgi:hypothetical protein
MMALTADATIRPVSARFSSQVRHESPISDVPGLYFSVNWSRRSQQEAVGGLIGGRVSRAREDRPFCSTRFTVVDAWRVLVPYIRSSFLSPHRAEPV